MPTTFFKQPHFNPSFTFKMYENPHLTESLYNIIKIMRKSGP